MPSTTQFGASRGEEICDVVVGFDFGTSCSKVILRTPFQNGNRAVAVHFGRAGHSSCRYLLPSVLWVGQGGALSLERSDAGQFLRDIKYHLMRGEVVKPPDGSGNGEDPNFVAVAFLALALREARRWFLEHEKTLYGGMRLRWWFNIGVPSADLSSGVLFDTYRDIARAAWALSVSEGDIRLDSARLVFEQRESWDDLDDLDMAEIDQIPEVAAEAVGYALSTERQDGLHILVDIGASTLDICSFVLHDNEGDKRYELLTADVRPLGASELYRERVTAVRQAVEEHLGSLWDDYDPVRPISNDAASYAPEHDTVRRALEQGDNNYRANCRRRIWQTIIDLKKTRNPLSDRWRTTMPIFLSGGASVMEFYKDIIKSLSPSLINLYAVPGGASLLQLPKPSTLVADIDMDSYHRFAVAWGLSFLKTDFGEFSLPAETDDLDPREPYDWGGKRFIDKEMV